MRVVLEKKVLKQNEIVSPSNQVMNSIILLFYWCFTIELKLKLEIEILEVDKYKFNSHGKLF